MIRGIRAHGTPRRSRVVALLACVLTIAAALTVTSVVTAGAAHAAPAGAGVLNSWSDGANRPLGLTVGPDGAIWFANNGGDSIGRAVIGGGQTIYRGPGISGPTAIAVGPDGALWFTNKNNNSIGRITTAGLVSNFTDASISAPDTIVKGADDALWFANTAGGSIGRITAAGEITAFTDPALAQPTAVTPGPDGNLWFTSAANNRVGRLTPAGVVTTFTDPKVSSPGKITAGSDGALFFTMSPSGVGRVTTTGTFNVSGWWAEPWTGPPYNLPTSARPIDIIAAGNHLVITDETDRVGRISTDLTQIGELSNYRPEGSDFGLRNIVQGPDAKLYVSGGTSSIISFTLGASGGAVDGSYGPSITGPGSRANGSIATGPDGAMWFQSGNNLGRIGISDLAMTTYSTNGLTPTGGLVAGPDGSMWFTVDGGIGRMRMNGAVWYFYNGSFSGAKGLTVGPDGALWFTAARMGPGTKGGVGRITTAGAITTFPNPQVDGPGGIVTGSDGALWFTNTTTSTLGRVTTAGAMTFFPGALKPTELAAGPDGALWYLNSQNNSIGRMTTDGVASFIPGVEASRSLAFGPGGTLWITSPGKLTSVDGAGVRAPHPVAEPNGIAAGPDGAMWFANDAGTSPSRSIGRIQATGTPSLTLTGTDGDHEIIARWDAIDGGSPITAVTVSASPGGASCTWTTGPQQCTIGGLTNGTAYTLSAMATNASGTSDNGPSAPITPAGVPSAPLSVSATPGSASATLSWTAGSDNGAPITMATFKAYRGAVLEKSGNLSVSETTVNGLTNGATYRFEVALVNRKGLGAFTSSAPTLISVPGAPRAPAFPTVVGGPNDSSVPGGAVTVSWWPQSGTTGAVVTPLRIYSTGNVQREAAVTVHDARNSVRVTQLATLGARYQFEIVLVNANGTGPPSVTREVSLNAPETPRATAVAGNGTATVSWAAPLDPSRVAGVRIFTYKDGVAQPSIVLGPNATSHVLSGVPNGTKYLFIVAFIAEYGGIGGGSQTDEVTVGAPQKLIFLKATAGPGRATVSWWPAVDNGSPITSYEVVVYRTGYWVKTLTFTNVVGSSLVVPDLLAGSPHTFAVRAVNARGMSPIGATTAPVTPT